jgi:hypothetical protein
VLEPVEQARVEEAPFSWSGGSDILLPIVEIVVGQIQLDDGRLGECL